MKIKKKKKKINNSLRISEGVGFDKQFFCLNISHPEKYENIKH